MKKARFLILLAVFTVVLALQVLPLYAVDWQPIYEGVDYAYMEKTSPRLMKAFAFRVDLQNPNVSLFATPDNGSAPRETTRQTTPAFRSTYGLEVAINANWSSLDDPNYAWVDGCLVSNGTVVSGWDRAQGSLRFTADKTPSFHYGEAPWDPSGFHTVVTGSWLCLSNGTPISDGTSTLAPRTTVGISQDNRYLIMCVVDGRQPGWSEGCTYQEAGQFQLDFGAYNAIHMDGGGSSCICSASGGVYNRPSDGSPRKVGANLGVNTIPLQLTEIIIDNPQGTCSANWATSTSSSQKYGEDYRWRSTQAISDSFTWTPNIPTAGNYEVYAWWPEGTNRHPEAPYIITYNGGSANVKVNQQVFGGQWNSLGIYPFAAGTAGNVKLSCWASTGYVVVADAVKFVKR